MAQPQYSSIRVWQKLLLIGLIGVALCAVPTVIFVRTSLIEIGIAQKELRGLEPANALVRLLQPLQTHRGLAAAVLSGDQNLAAMRPAKEKEVTEAFSKVRAALPESATAMITELAKAEAEWKSLVTSLKDRGYPVEDSYKRHGKLIEQTIGLVESTIDHFGLSLDPAAETNHMVAAAYIDLPKLTEAMGRMRAIGTSILGIKQATAEERVTIASMLERTREEMSHADLKIKKAVEANVVPMDALLATLKKAQEDTQKLTAVTDLEFMRIEVLRYEPMAYLKLATTAIDGQFAVIHAARTEIERELNERVGILRTRMLLLVGLVVAMLLLGAAAMFWVARSIVAPLNAAVEDANAIAAGRLDSTIVNTGNDEVGQLRRAMRQMQQNLAHIVFSIRENSESVDTAAQEIASSTRNMSARTEEHASSLEQTAASMEEMNSSVQQNDQSSQNAADLASGAAQAAERGRDVVHQVANTMQEINTSSKQIAEISSVIDSIAFQTNILALNAAVEAARAGEQGRGFAVVATEVRALAQRSGQASKEIRALISESVKKVQGGTREALEAGDAMEEILSAARNVEHTVKQIRLASQDQRQGISQVSRAVEHMNEGTQQNAAMVEQIAATADLLASQAQELTKAVSAFKLAGANGEESRHGDARRSFDDAASMDDDRYVLDKSRDELMTASGALPLGDARRMLPPGKR